MQCYNCGAENMDTNTQCYNCGADLSNGYYLPDISNYENNTAEYAGAKKNTALLIGLVIGGAVLAITVVIGVYIFLQNSAGSQYQEKLIEASQYMEQADYEAAIRIYQEAIEINDKDPNAYLGIAQAYYSSGDRMVAIEWLNIGFQKTGNPQINDLLSIYINLTTESVETEEDVLELLQKEDMNAISIQNNLFEVVLNNTYSIYVRDYGTATTLEQTSDSVKITYENFAGYTCFENTDQKIFDSTTGKPMVNATASYVCFTDLSMLFPNMAVGITAERMRELFGPDIEIRNEDGRYISCVEYSGCFVEIETDEAGNLLSREAWNKITPNRNVDNKEEKENTGFASGKIINATTGAGINAVHLVIHKGADSPNGEVVGELDTDNHGGYTIELPEGKYTISASANGFMSENFNITVMHGMTMANQNLTMTSNLSVGEVRIVLEWGSSPNDLDSHLKGRTADGQSVYINFTNKVSSVNGTVIATLDVDDMSGFGPETTTITDGSTGSYEFYVVDFSNGGNSASTALAGSGATVKVYVGGKEPQIFNVPSGSGTIWHVFRLENGVITKMDYIDNLS